MSEKLLALLLAVSLLFMFCAAAEETAAAERKPVAILYTNDVHCAFDSGVGYDGLAAYKKAYEAAGYDTLLVDVGDAVQGASVGVFSRGEYIIDLMNAVGYDVATIGNHEFDYGMDRFNELRGMADFEYVCCNFTDLEGSPVFTPYTIREAGGYRIAFIGIVTPETFMKSTPAFFQDDEGNYICDFCGGNGGADLYECVQKSVDAARAEGAEIVIALSHLGDEYIGEGMAWTCGDVVTHTNGIDAALDGHAHHIFENVPVLNKDGAAVPTTSTGTRFENIGVLIIDADGAGKPVLTPTLHNETVFKDPETVAVMDEIRAKCDAKLKEVVAHTDVDLVIFDPVATDVNGNAVRIVRSQETNLGDLCADAYRALGQADVGVVNGGGIRASIPAGDVTYEQFITVHPFGHALTVVEATGAQILDLLEMSVSKLPAENGGFVQVSGMSFTVDMSVPSGVILDEHGNFVGVEGARRVRSVMIGAEPLDPEKTYTVASHDFLLLGGGDGINMFRDCNVLLEGALLENEVLQSYISDMPGGTVGEAYADPYGEGRITIING